MIDFNTYQKLHRKLNDNLATRKYEKTKKGFLVRVYRNMKSRVTGIQKKKAHLYFGKSLLDKESFYKWSLNDISFNQLFDNWTKLNYNRKICPSINRIDSSMGYEMGNIEWITFSENCKLGCLSRYN